MNVNWKTISPQAIEEKRNLTMQKMTFLSAAVGIVLFWQAESPAIPLKSEKYAFAINPNQTLEVELNIQYSSNFRIRPNTDAKQVTVKLDYDTDYLTSEVHFDRETNHLNVELTGESWKDNWSDDSKRGECTVYLPAGVPIDLESDSKVGEIDFELGGLSLKFIHLEVFAGSVQIRFRKPNGIVLEDFDISGKVGELDLQQFGNARFQTGVIETGVGEMDLDLSGVSVDFPQDLNVEFKIGDANILLPRHRPIKLRVSKLLFLTQIDLPPQFEKRGSAYFFRAEKGSKNLLYVRVSAGLGNLSVDFE